MLTSVVQLVLSCITIYRSRGSQLDQYGYAAFGLSVFPYAVMSFINLLFAGVLGEYPCLYILRTGILDEAKQCGPSVSSEIGVLGETTTDEKVRVRRRVATWLKTEKNEQGKILTLRRDVDGATTRRFKLVGCGDPADFVFGVDSVTNFENEKPATESTEPQSRQDRLFFSSWIVSSMIVFVIPYVFIFLLTRFHKQDSSLAERAWMMSWLVANQLSFVILIVFGALLPQISVEHFMYLLLLMSPALIPAIGGLVTVGKMAFKFGSCS
jgi:hypothetical protein